MRRAQTVQTHIVQTHIYTYIPIYIYTHTIQKKYSHMHQYYYLCPSIPSPPTHTQVVPFLPLSEAQLREILDLKLEEMSNEHRSVCQLASQSVSVYPSLCLCVSLRLGSVSGCILLHGRSTPHTSTFQPQHSGRLWSRLETTPELRDHLVRSPFVKYAGYGFEREQPQTPPAPADSCEADGAGDDCEADAKGKGRGVEEGVYWFAEFGARNLHVGGPIQVSIH